MKDAEKVRVPWVRVDVDLASHPKALRLERILGVEKAYAYVLEIWAYCANFARDGLIPEDDLPMLADRIRWKREPQLLFDAIRKAGFAEPSHGDLVVHDWWKLNGSEVQGYVRDVIRKRVNRAESQRGVTADGPRHHRGSVDVDVDVIKDPPSEGFAAGAKPTKTENLSGQKIDPETWTAVPPPKTKPETNGHAYEAKAAKPKKPRKPSFQEDFRERWKAERKDALGKSWVPDQTENWDSATCNKQLACLKSYHPTQVAEAVAAFFADPKRLFQNPPYSLLYFVKDRGTYGLQINPEESHAA